MKSRVKPLKPIIPQEFSSKCRITSKQFAFSQPVPRVKSVQASIPNKTFQDDSDPEENENKIKNESGDKNQSQNENDQKIENQSNNDINNDENDFKQNDTGITVTDDFDQDANLEEEEFTSQNNTEQKQPTILDDEEMISLKNELMESHDFSQIEPSKLDRFFQYIKEYTKYTASQADYEEAKKAKNLKDETASAIYKKKNDKEKSDEEKQELEKMKIKQEEKWQNEVNSYDQETNQKLEDLNKQQEDERRAFDEFWNSEKTLRKYRKPSARLLQLWRMEKFLAKTGSFDEANVVRLEAAELAKREIALAQATANRDYHSEKEKLSQRQESDVESLIQNREHWRAVMISRQNVEKAVVVNREAVVEVRQKEPPQRREAQLPPGRRRGMTKHSKNRSSASSTASVKDVDGDSKKSKNDKKSGKVKEKREAEISFNYCTILPPVASPVTSSSTPQDDRSVASAKSNASSNNRMDGEPVE